MDDIFRTEIDPNRFGCWKDQLICRNDSVLRVFEYPEKSLASDINGDCIIDLGSVEFQFLECSRIVGIRYAVHQYNALQGGDGQNDQNYGRSDDQCCFNFRITVSLGRNFLGILFVFNSVSPNNIQQTTPNHTEQKNRDPHGKHKNVILILSDQAFGIESGLLMINSRAGIE